MDDTKALAVEVKAGSIAIRNVDEALRLGEIFYKSGFFQDVHSAAQAIVKMLAGAELGFGPIASMSGVYVQNGRTAFMANLIASAIKRGGYDYKVETLTNEQCVLVFFGKDGKEIGESPFTMADAKIAGLDTGKNAHSWKHFPRNMLFARALTNGARWFTPEIFGGVSPYTPDELDMVVDGETGEVISEVEAPEPIMSTPTSESRKNGLSAQELAKLQTEKKVALKSTPVGEKRFVELLGKSIPADERVSDKAVRWFNENYVGPHDQKQSLEEIGKFHPSHLVRHLMDHFGKDKTKLAYLNNEQFVALVKYVRRVKGMEGGELVLPWYADKVKEVVGEAPQGNVVVEAQETPYAVTLADLQKTWYGPEGTPVFPGNNPNIETVAERKWGKPLNQLGESELNALYNLAVAVKDGLVKVQTVEDAVKELEL